MREARQPAVVGEGSRAAADCQVIEHREGEIGTEVVLSPGAGNDRATDGSVQGVDELIAVRERR
jgi:hypothetical protein